MTISVLERDEDGRPSAFHVEQEAEFDDEQVALLVAAQRARDEIGPHGIPMKDATSPLADPNNRREGWHYEPRFRVDHAERAKNQALADRAKAFPNEDQGSLLVSLERVEETPPKPRKPRTKPTT
jgi:hypothetical protein